jgi:hypothetical protein
MLVKMGYRFLRCSLARPVTLWSNLRKQTQVFCVSNENQLMRLMLKGYFTFALITFLSSCSNNNEETIYKTLTDGFTASYKLINRQSETELAVLQNKKLEPATAMKATIWHERALAIRESSKAMMKYIGKMKTSEQMQKSKAYEAYDSLNRFKEFILNIDPLLRSEFSNLILADSSVEKNVEVLEGFAAEPMLTYIQNNIAIAENRLIRFCNEQVSTSFDRYDTYSAIIAQNSKYVKPGDQIEITAGIGAFSRAASPSISVAGINMAIEEDAAVHYKSSAPNQIGKHIIPVKIEFRDQDGRPQLITKDVEFTVMKQ